MAETLNRILVKRGQGAPGTGVLDLGELGYDTLNKTLYIGNGLNTSPSQVGNGFVSITKEENKIYFKNAEGNSVDFIELKDFGITTPLNVLNTLESTFSWINSTLLTKADNTIKINNHPLTESFTLTPEDIGAVPTSRMICNQQLLEDLYLTAEDVHARADDWIPSASEITAGVLSIQNGGTGSANGATGLKNLFAAGATILSSNQYGTSLPSTATAGRIFFKKVT